MDTTKGSPHVTSLRCCWAGDS